MSIISIISFIHSVQDYLPQVFIETIGFTIKNYIERNNFATLLWTWFLRKMFSKVSSERVLILIIHNLLSYILEVLFNYIFDSVLGISNVKVIVAFACALVNNTTSMTFCNMLNDGSQ